MSKGRYGEKWRCTSRLCNKAFWNPSGRCPMCGKRGVKYAKGWRKHTTKEGM